MKKNLLKVKEFKLTISDLEGMVGTYGAGLLVAILTDAVADFCKDSPSGRELRSVEIKFNDFFSHREDFKEAKNNA